MIHKFSFSNFYSCLDEQTVDFRVNEHAPDSEAYVTSKFGPRLNTVMVAFGHNASGKTNMLRVLPFLRWLFVESFSAAPEANFDFEPFHFNSTAFPTRLTSEFETENRLFSYSVELDWKTDKILLENMEFKTLDDQRIRPLFKREWVQDRGEYVLTTNKSSGFEIPDNFRAIQTRKNASVPAIAAQIGEPLSVEIRNQWNSYATNVNVLGRDVISPLDRVFESAEALRDNPMLLDDVGKQVAQFDLGIKGLELRDVQVPGLESTTRPRVYLVARHKLSEEDDPVFLPLYSESEGSINLVAFLSQIIPVICAGGLCVLDEMDADIHPLVIPNLLDLFMSSHRNPKNAQLLCSCHSAPVLNHLDKYQILLTEKDPEGRAHVWRLDDMPKVRVDDNYYAKYMAGAYGAIPNF